MCLLGSTNKIRVDVGVEGSVGVGAGVCGCVGEVTLAQVADVGDKSIDEDLSEEEEVVRMFDSILGVADTGTSCE